MLNILGCMLKILGWWIIASSIIYLLLNGNKKNTKKKNNDITGQTQKQILKEEKSIQEDSQDSNLDMDNKYLNDVPYWEKQYIYGNEYFPNKEVRKFYEYYRKEFLKGNFIDLKGNTNYSFLLMFDLLGKRTNNIIHFSIDRNGKPYKITSPQCKYGNLETHLVNLMIHYPEVRPYCEDEMGKLNIPICEYKGEKYTTFTRNCYISSQNFPYKNEIMNWLKSDEFKTTGLRVYVNSMGQIDAVIDNNIELYGNEKRGCRILLINSHMPSFINFNIVEGNFTITNTGWSSEKNRLSGYKGGEIDWHIIDNINGSPKIVKGDFKIENLGITSLEGSPQRVEGNFLAKKNSISNFIGVPLFIGGNMDLSSNELTDEAWEYAKDYIESECCGNYNIKNNNFVKYRQNLY